MKREIKQVHFQLTRNCNLRCSFCGQWGKKGFFADSCGEEMSLDDWNRIIHELEEYRDKTGISQVITLWGGEPLVSPYFDEIAGTLRQKEFKTEVITNGILIDKHKEAIQKIDNLYISLDGTKEVHDKIRGDGVYDKVKNNIKSINHKNIIIMSVITPELIKVLPEFLDELEELNIKALYLQDMIGLDKKEIGEYKSWLNDTFGMYAKDIDSWRNDDLFRVEEVKIKTHSYKIEHKNHNVKGFCKSPFYHVHIAWNGIVLYCTDFYDFSAGSVKTETLKSIFFNNKSEGFRNEIIKNKCVTCRHCSWREKVFSVE